MLHEEKLTALKKELIEFASLVERMIEKSVKGLVQRQKELLAEVINTDEPKANLLDIRMDELCTSLIAQYQPMAKDLRTILMVFKMNDDLERMADHAVNISESGLYLLESPSVKPLIDIPEMQAVTAQMVRDSITAFIDENALLAKEVCARDNVIDDLRDKVYRELFTVMHGNAAAIDRSLHLMRIARNLERIADLSTNICEDVIFMVQGKVIKHHKTNGDDQAG
jgi:phosphate transport system protein